MGISIAVQSASSGSVLSLISGVGVGLGGIFVTAVLVHLLGYLNVVKASERHRQRLQSLLVMTSIPLMFAFGGLIAFESLSVLGFV